MTRAHPAIAILAIGALLAVNGCGGGGDSSSVSEGGSTGGERTASIDGVIGVAGNPELGEILVNDLGLTLYVFEKDKGKSSCYGECEATWPPMTTTAAGQIGGVTDKQAAMLGTTTRKDGTLQVSYAGHPIYTYVDDEEPGEANGQGIDSFGGKWYALTPEGEEAGR